MVKKWVLPVMSIVFSLLLVSCSLAADKRITEMTEDTDPTNDDLLLTVNDPDGTPANRKVTIENFIAAITGLDISNSTNLAVTAPIVLTDDTLSCSNATESAKGCMQVGTGLDVSSGTVSVDITELALTSAYIWVGGSGNTATAVDPAGDVEISNTGATSIGDDKVTEAMLKAVNAPTDEDILTYEETTGDFEWQTSAESGLVTGPASSTDNALVRFDSTTGKIVQNYTSGAPTCGDTGTCTFANGVIISGGAFDQTDIVTFTANDDSPSVSTGNLFKTANTEATTITAFDNAVNGQYFTVLINDAYTTIDCSTGDYIVCNNAIDWVPASGDHMDCVYDGTKSYCAVYGGNRVFDFAGNTSITDNGNSGTTKTITWGSSNRQKVILTGNCTFTFTAPSTIAGIRLYLYQDGTGSRTATWPATVKWPGGTAPTLTTTANALDIISCDYIGSDYECGVNLDMK